MNGIYHRLSRLNNSIDYHENLAYSMTGVRKKIIIYLSSLKESLFFYFYPNYYLITISMNNTRPVIDDAWLVTANLEDNRQSASIE